LNENLFDCGLECVNVTEIQLFEVIIAVNCRTNASCLQNDVFVFSVFDNEMENVVEFGGIISIANHIKLQFLSRLQEGMLDFRFEN
jgi:hypothetical protein